MIHFTTPITLLTDVQGTSVETTFNRLSPTGNPEEYEMFWVVENEGDGQSTSNGVTRISDARLADLCAIDGTVIDEDTLSADAMIADTPLPVELSVLDPVEVAPVVFKDDQQYALSEHDLPVSP